MLLFNPEDSLAFLFSSCIQMFWFPWKFTKIRKSWYISHEAAKDKIMRAYLQWESKWLVNSSTIFKDVKLILHMKFPCENEYYSVASLS